MHQIDFLRVFVCIGGSVTKLKIALPPIRLPANAVSVILTQPLRNAGRMIGSELLNELDDSAGSGFPAL